MPTKISELTDMFLKRYRKDIPITVNDVTIPNGVGMDSYAAGVETLNGESMLVLYNHKCLPPVDKSTVRQLISEYNNDSSWNHNKPLYEWMQHNPQGVYSYFFLQSLMCVNFIYDLNGKKGPNKMNKDIGYMTVFYPTDSDVVAPVFSKTPRNPEDSQSFSMPYNLAAQACEQSDKNSRLATLNEIMAMTVNYKLHGTGQSEYAVAGWGGGDSLINEDYAWKAGEKHGWIFPELKSEQKKVGCVKR